MPDEVSQFLADYKAARNEPDFNSKDFTASYQAGLSKDRSQPETTEDMNNKGFVRQSAEDLATGVMGNAELWMQAVRDMDPRGGNDVIRDFATYGVDAIRNFVAKHPSLAPDPVTETGVHRWWREGLRSFAPSILTPLAGAAIGATVGQPIIGGAAVSGAIFYLAEHDRFMEEVDNRITELGMSEQEAIELRREARMPAIYSAIAEGGFEAAANALQLRVFKNFFPGRKMIKGLAGTSVKSLFTQGGKKAIKQGAKKLAVTTPVELGTEFAQSVVETKFRNDIGLTDMDKWGAGIDVLGPAFVTNLLFLGVSGGAGAHQRWSIRHSLEDAQTNQHRRGKAVKDIANVVRGMKHENSAEMANELERSGMAHVNTGLGIDINSDLGMETTLEKLKNSLQEGDIQLDVTSRMQKALEKELNGDTLSTEQRVPAFQLFQGISKINEDFLTLRDARKAEADAQSTTKTSEADKLDQNSSTIHNQNAEGAKGTKKGESKTAEETAREMQNLGQEATEEGAILEANRVADEALLKRVRGETGKERAAEKSKDVGGIVSGAEQESTEERIASETKAEREAEKGRTLDEPTPLTAEEKFDKAAEVGQKVQDARGQTPEEEARETESFRRTKANRDKEAVKESPYNLPEEEIVDELIDQKEALKKAPEEEQQPIKDRIAVLEKVQSDRKLGIKEGDEAAKKSFQKALDETSFPKKVELEERVTSYKEPKATTERKEFERETVGHKGKKGISSKEKVERIKTLKDKVDVVSGDLSQKELDAIKDKVTGGKKTTTPTKSQKEAFFKEATAESKKKAKDPDVPKMLKRQITLLRKEIADPSSTPEEIQEAKDALDIEGVPYESPQVAGKKKKKKEKKEKKVETVPIQDIEVSQDQKGLNSLLKQLRKTEARFVHGGTTDEQKQALKVDVLAMRDQLARMEKKLGLTAQTSYEKAVKNANKKMNRKNLGVDPTIMADLAVIGNHHFSRGLTTFVKWSKAVIADTFEGVRSLLRRVFKQVKTDQKVEAEVSKFVDPISQKTETEGKDLGRKVTPFVQEIFDKKLGPKHKGKTFKEKRGEVFSGLKIKLRQGFIDQYASLKLLDDKLWKLAQVTTSSSGAMETILTQGPLTLTGGVPDIKDPKGGKGLWDVLKPLGRELETWLGVIAGRRANELMKEGKENNLTQDEIDELMVLDQGTMEDGRDRETVYREAWEGFNELHNSILDVGVGTGTINKQERETWRDAFYIPFFRLLQKEKKVQGPRTLGGISNQDAFHELKGEAVPIADMLTNTILNWNHMVGASMKNQVAVKTVHQAINHKFPSGDPIAIKLGADMDIVELEDGQFEVLTADGKGKGKFETYEKAEEHAEQLNDIIARKMASQLDNTIYVRENGKKVWYQVNEPNVFQALTNLNYEGFNTRAMKAMRSFKRFLTFGVTFSPEFKLRNLFRDTVHATAVSPIGLNMIDNVFIGEQAIQKNTVQAMRMMAGGGNIMFGHLYGTDPEKVQHQLAKSLKKENILDNPEAFGKLERAMAKVKGGFNWWQELGSKMENVNRSALFIQTLEKSESQIEAKGLKGAEADAHREDAFLEANFQARDLLDFDRHGAYPAIRFLIDTVPFMNARIQGLDKLGRTATGSKGEKARMAAVLGGVAMASAALYLAFRNDEDFKEREDWDRDTYYWFKIPGTKTAFRLPKPFEVGAVGTIAERLVEQFVDDEVHGELFGERLAHMLRETFALGGIPQIAKPILELSANKNFFTDRPIETLTMQNLSPFERRKAWTSETAILLSKGFTSIPWDKVQLSPVQVEHLVKGYFGWVGANVLKVVDTVATRPIGGFSQPPFPRIEDIPGLGPFVRGTPSRQTKYASIFYEGLKEMNETYNDIRNFRMLGETEKALNLARKSRDKLRYRKLANKLQKNISAVTKRIRLVRLDKTMSRKHKRVKIDNLTVMKTRMLKMAVSRTSL